MAGKTTTMSKLKQLLHLKQAGTSIKGLAKTLNISRNTVKSHLKKLQTLGTPIAELLKLDDMELEKRFFGGNPAYTQPQKYQDFKEKISGFVEELKDKKVTRLLLHEEYKIENTNGYSYTQFNHHLNQHLLAKKPSMVMKYNPGEKLMIDFAGDPIQYIDRTTGELINCPVLVCTLPYSDYGFAIALRNQTAEEVVYGLIQCLSFFGGVAQILIPDNMKTAVIKSSRYEPTINQIMEDFCNHYGMAIVPTRVAKPKDKALVENKVKNYYTQIYARLRKCQFFSLHELNAGIRAMCIKHNQRRMQRNPYSREEKFLAEEQKNLRALPADVFQVKYYREHKVSGNNHIYMAHDKHYYSVPYEHIGRVVKVIYTRSIVRIYFNRELVAEHPRSFAQGRYSTIQDHLCSAHQNYLELSPDKYRQQATHSIPEMGYLIDKVFLNGRHPEQNYNTCRGLFALEKKTEKDIFKRACQTVIDCDVISYRFLQKVITHLSMKPPQTSEQTSVPTINIPAHENIRDANYYQ